MADAFAAIVPIGRQLFVSAFVFRPGFSSTWAANRLQIERKLATSYAPLVGRPAAHFRGASGVFIEFHFPLHVHNLFTLIISVCSGLMQIVRLTRKLFRGCIIR